MDTDAHYARALDRDGVMQQKNCGKEKVSAHVDVG